MEAKRFPTACVASPHYLASSAGLAVLASGGNALDAAIAANLTLGVVTPYLCGFGGDLFAILCKEGAVFAYNGSGRAPAAASLEIVRRAVGSDHMPADGPHSVTVPGAVEAWFALLERFGTMWFGDLVRQARRYAHEGFPLTAKAEESLTRARERFADSPEWMALYGQARVGQLLHQPGLARTIDMLSTDGPDAFYRGQIGLAIADHVRSLGGLLSEEDLAEHRGEWVAPISTGYRDVEILELPPNAQGIAVLEALRIVEGNGDLPPDGPDRHHILIEAMKVALADRDAYVTDPAEMRRPVEDLMADDWISGRLRGIDLHRAAEPMPGRAAVGGTAYMCAADADGMCVSMIQSNYMGFGSGVTVPDWGINLQNRGAYFSLDSDHVNVIAPRKRTLHTLIPAMALRAGRPWLAFGTMGGDGQAQTHLQLLTRIIDDGEDVQRAIDAPRWAVSPGDWAVLAESRFDPAWLADLRARGHRVSFTEQLDPVMGHAHAILAEDNGYAGATDPRSEGAVLGL
ncbi:MAG TPA: gamma-glutamyltransferase family protein [Actinomycetota bacterium]|jgi:gamma-glutamyltranspeptidase/glutathione hydrolase